MVKPEEQEVDNGPRCLSCNGTSSRHLRTGPDGPRTLCDRCSQRYGKHRLRLFQGRDNRVSARWHPGWTPVVSVDFVRDKFNKRDPARPIVRQASSIEHHELTIRRRPGRPPRSACIKNDHEPASASGSSSRETQVQLGLQNKEELVEAPVPGPATPAGMRNLPSRAARHAANERNATLLSSPISSPRNSPLHIARPRTPSPGPTPEDSIYLGKRKRLPGEERLVYRRLAPENQGRSHQDVKTDHAVPGMLIHQGHAFVPFVPVVASGSATHTSFAPNGIMIKVQLRRVIDSQVSCVRILAIPSAYSWPSLKAHFKSAFRVIGPLSCTYRDRSGATIALSSDLDMPGFFYVASLVGLVDVSIVEISSA